MTWRMNWEQTVGADVENTVLLREYSSIERIQFYWEQTVRADLENARYGWLGEWMENKLREHSSIERIQFYWENTVLLRECSSSGLRMQDRADLENEWRMNWENAVLLREYSSSWFRECKIGLTWRIQIEPDFSEIALFENRCCLFVAVCVAVRVAVCVATGEYR